jgi:hypothetical protein
VDDAGRDVAIRGRVGPVDSWTTRLAAVVLLVGVPGGGFLLRGEGAPVPEVPAAASVPLREPARPGPDPVAVLRAWDAARAEAWRQADPAGLRRLYLPASVAGRRDVAALRDYRRRGLRVRGLQVQLLRAELVRGRPDALVVRVTDRVVGAVAVGPDSSVRLPRDQPSTRVVQLVLRNGAWRVGRVRAAR